MSNRRGRAARAGLGLAAVAGALALVLVPATGASAHDYLVSSSPAAGSTVSAPLDTVTLTFNDLVLDLSGDGSSAILEVTGPDAQTTHFETGCASILGRDLSAPVALGAAGTYRVSWQIVSSDGHPVSDSLTFAYAPPAGAVASAGTATAPACGRAVAADPGTGQEVSPSAGEGAAGWAILAVAGGIVLLALIGVVVVVLIARRGKISKKIPDPTNPES